MAELEVAGIPKSAGYDSAAAENNERVVTCSRSVDLRSWHEALRGSLYERRINKMNRPVRINLGFR